MQESNELLRLGAVSSDITRHGTLLRIRFTEPFDGLPLAPVNWLSGELRGVSCGYPCVGAYAEIDQLPKPALGQLSGPSALTPSSYCTAYVLRSLTDGSIQCSDVTAFVQSTGQQNIIEGFPAQVPVGYVADVYLGQSDSTLTLYATNLPAKTSTFSFTVAQPVNGQPFPGRKLLTWTGLFRIPRQTPDSPVLLVTAPSGLLTDTMGRETEGFSIIATNRSWVDSNGNAYPFQSTNPLYISSSKGLDTNAGTQNAPIQTLAKGKSLIQSGGRTSCLLLCGDTWNEELDVRGGGTAIAPFVYGSYGTGSPPNITNGYNTVANINSVGYTLLTGLQFSSPETPGATTAQVTHFAPISGVMFSDCLFQGVQLTVQAINGPIGDVAVHRCRILDTATTGNGNTAGGYFDGIMDLVISDPVVDNCGKPGNIFRHGFYINYGNRPVAVDGGCVSNSGSHGIQLRCGGAIFGTLLWGNPIGCFVMAQPGGSLYHSYIGGGVDIGPTLPRGWGAQVNGQINNQRNIPGITINVAGCFFSDVTLWDGEGTQPQAFGIMYDPQMPLATLWNNLQNLGGYGQNVNGGTASPNGILIQTYILPLNLIPILPTNWLAALRNRNIGSYTPPPVPQI